MFILTDINEAATNPAVIRRLQKVFPNIEITQLAFGDVNVILNDGNILAIERKRIGDFLSSIGDGRVFRQVESMSNGAKWCCIIVEGELHFNEEDMAVIDNETTNWKGSSVRGAMMAIQWSGCPILFTHKNNYPFLIDEIIRFVSKSDVHEQLTRKRIVTFPPVELKEEILASFPGIGLKRARSLLEFSGNGKSSTLAEAVVWGTSLSQINQKSRPAGWGDKTVENFRQAFGLASNQYLNIDEEGKENQ